MDLLDLLSLNDDVLSEILSFLLLDTPRELNRNSVLRTCSTLYRLGRPHLYRVVDLTGYATARLLKSGSPWTALFGRGGILTVEGRDQQVGRMVKVLRLGCDSGFYPRAQTRPARVPKLNLPSCTSLLLDLVAFTPRNPPQPLYLLLPQLPVLDLSIDYVLIPGNHTRHILNSFMLHSGRFAEVVPGLSSQQPWDLRSLTFRNTVWYDEIKNPDYRRKLSLSDWTFRVLVVHFDEPDGYGHDVWGEKKVVKFFLDVKSTDQDSFLPQTERIEFRGGGKVLRKEFRKVVAKRVRVGWSEFERRIASMILFVDDDGTERRLMEELGNLP